MSLALIGALLLAGGCGKRNQAAPEAPVVVPAAPTDTPVPAATSAPTDTPAPTAEPAATETPAAAETGAASAEEEAYPAPVGTAAADAAAAPAEEGAYPPPQVESAGEEGAYPAPVAPAEETSSIPIVPFVIERPVPAGATVIRGTGPAGVPILIINVTFMGEVLGEGVIGEDGTFEVEVPPLEDQLWVGVAPGELAGSDLTYEDLTASGFNGEGAAQVPQIGFVYDSITVGQ